MGDSLADDTLAKEGFPAMHDGAGNARWYTERFGVTDDVLIGIDAHQGQGLYTAFVGIDIGAFTNDIDFNVGNLHVFAQMDRFNAKPQEVTDRELGVPSVFLQGVAVQFDTQTGFLRFGQLTVLEFQFVVDQFTPQ